MIVGGWTSVGCAGFGGTGEGWRGWRRDNRGPDGQAPLNFRDPEGLDRVRRALRDGARRVGVQAVRPHPAHRWIHAGIGDFARVCAREAPRGDLGFEHREGALLEPSHADDDGQDRGECGQLRPALPHDQTRRGRGQDGQQRRREPRHDGRVGPAHAHHQRVRQDSGDDREQDQREHGRGHPPSGAAGAIECDGQDHRGGGHQRQDISWQFIPRNRKECEAQEQPEGQE